MGIRFDYGIIKSPSTTLSPEDPDYVGPKMQVFSKDMPGRWKQLLMGFNECGCDDEEVSSSGESDDNEESARRRTGWTGDPTAMEVYPREDYVRMWMTCDEGLYMLRFGGVLDKVEELLEKLEKRETRFVRAGAAKKRVDDMLEYAVR